jgi:hypothetical protein
MDLCDGLLPVPRSRVILERDLGETGIKYFQGFFKGTCGTFTVSGFWAAVTVYHTLRQVAGGKCIHTLGKFTT